MGRAGGLLLLPLLLAAPGGAGAERCGPSASCEECVRMHPRCAWCEQPGFLPRCAPPEVLEGAGCPPGAVVLPRGSLRVLQDQEVLPGGGHVPLRPQHVQMWLLPGEEQSFQVRFRRPAGHPVDLYYLMDLSYSMRDDLETIRGLGSDLMATLRNFSSSVRIGLGSFVEKPVLPFSSAGPQLGPCPRGGDPCEAAAAFRHVLALSGRAGAFTERLGGLRSAGNLDAPESGFDALLQAAVCGDRLGWGSATRVLLFCSDDAWHSAGDGKLGGITRPSDTRCHLDASGHYTAGHRHDYPSVGLLAQVLAAADIQLIFAVTRPVVPLYEELSQELPRAVVRELRGDSSNVLRLLADAYEALASTVELKHSPLPLNISLSFESHCGGAPGPPRPHGGLCTGVRVNEEVTFTVRVRAASCPLPRSRVTLRVPGLQGALQLELGARCPCRGAPQRAGGPLRHGGNPECRSPQSATTSDQPE